MSKTHLLWLFFLSLTAGTARAQGIDTVSFDTLPHVNLERKADTVFSTLNYSKITTGILVDKVFPFCDARSFTGDTTKDSIQFAGTVRILDAYLHFASFSQNHVLHPDTLSKRINGDLAREVIPIPILRAEYNIIRDSAFIDSQIVMNNEQLYDRTDGTHSPYYQNTSFAAMPAVGISSRKVTYFRIDTSVYYSRSTTDTLKEISVDFGDGNGFVYVGMDTVIPIEYDTDGKRLVRVSCIFNSDTLTTITRFDVEHIYLPQPDTIMHVYGDTSVGHMGSKGATVQDVISSRGAKFSIYYSTESKQAGSVLRRPVMLVQGFYPGGDEDLILGNETFSAVYKNYFRKDLNDHANNDDYEGSFVCYLRNAGYDVIIVKWDEPTIDLYGNALNMIAIINYVNQHKVGHFENIIMGASMGGIIARIALSRMEGPTSSSLYAPHGHQCRLYVSYDSPQKHAYFPIAGQYFYRYIENVLPDWVSQIFLGMDILSGGASGSWGSVVSVLDRTATIQLLKYWLSPTFFYTPLFDVAYVQRNDDAYPAYPNSRRTRIAAIIQGSDNGTDQGYDGGSEIFHWEFWGLWSAQFSLYSMNGGSCILGGCAAVLNMTIVNPLAFFGFGSLVYDYPWICPSPSDPWDRAFDRAPGSNLGTHNGLDAAIDFINQNLSHKWATLWAGGPPASNDGHSPQCFVPTYSSMDLPNESDIISNGPSKWTQSPFSGHLYHQPSNLIHVSDVSQATQTMFYDLMQNEIMPDDYKLSGYVLDNTDPYQQIDFEATHSFIAGADPSIPNSNDVFGTGTEVTIKVWNSTQGSYFETNDPNGGLVGGRYELNHHASSWAGDIHFTNGFEFHGDLLTTQIAANYPADCNCTELESANKIAVKHPSPTVVHHVTVSPNPVTGIARVRFHGVAPGPYSIEVFDATGTCVLVLKNFDSKAARDGEIELDASSLRSGAYFVTLESNGNKDSFKIIVLK